MVKIIFESDNGIGQVFSDLDFTNIDFPNSRIDARLWKVRLTGF
jgi:hypothetical protein